MARARIDKTVRLVGDMNSCVRYAAAPPNRQRLRPTIVRFAAADKQNSSQPSQWRRAVRTRCHRSRAGRTEWGGGAGCGQSGAGTARRVDSSIGGEPRPPVCTHIREKRTVGCGWHSPHSARRLPHRHILTTRRDATRFRKFVRAKDRNRSGIRVSGYRNPERAKL